MIHLIRYVLPNRYLFELADRPPADMAALLSIFRPVPPLVRTKATSLLETIRAAVKESLSPKTGNDNVDNTKPPEIAQVIPMDEEPSTSEKFSADESKSTSVLWSSQKPSEWICILSYRKYEETFNRYLGAIFILSWSKVWKITLGIFIIWELAFLF